ncbi:MAG: hypothetical protein ACRC6E_02295 [Fusobacteriaceae bacterium]
MEIAIHSIEKHRILQSLNIKCLRTEERYGTNLRIFIYEKTNEVLEVLNNANIQKFN